MEIIKPSEISGKIMSLIDEATQFVVIVSPYYNLGRWQKLTSRIEKAVERDVDFTFYVRKPETINDQENINEINKIGFIPLEIYRLHAKIYFNESEAIISSMNLNVSSDTSSLDIGVITKNKEEYDDVIRFYEKYIKSNIVESYIKDGSFWEKLEGRLKNIFPNVHIQEEYGIKVDINDGEYRKIVGNGPLSYKLWRDSPFYSFFFSDGILETSLSSKETLQNYFHTNRIFEYNGITFKLEIDNKSKNNFKYQTRFKSENFYSILNTEADKIIETITGFIGGIEKIKQFTSKN